jgi:3'5'-cyclic nucleotide phosphodiesterase
VDHSGVSNDQLVAEKDALAGSYENQSVAEQLTIAWELLMRPEYGDLRNCLFNHGEAEMLRFRQLLDHAVIATDVFDMNLKEARENRWRKEFGESFDALVPCSDSKSDASRHAAIILDHLIQASDISHTIQHFQVYQKWSRRLFHEQYRAFLASRSSAHPGVSWDEGELRFFDNYVIPLAKRLLALGNMFGFSWAELVDYALDNRAEWESRGRELVQQMMQEFDAIHEEGQATSVDGTTSDRSCALGCQDPLPMSGEEAAVAMSDDGPDQPEVSHSKPGLVFKVEEEWVGVRFV